MLSLLFLAGIVNFLDRSTREWFSSATRERAAAVMSSSSTIGLAFAPPVLTVPFMNSFDHGINIPSLIGLAVTPR